MNKKHNEHLQAKSQTYQRLAALLQKKRPAWQVRQINNILSQKTLKDAQKIRKIELLDDIANKIALKQKDPLKLPKITSKAKTAKKTTQQNKKTSNTLNPKKYTKAKSPPPKTKKTTKTLYQKLFPTLYNYQKIKAFSSKNNLIIVKYLPPRITLNEPFIKTKLSEIKNLLQPTVQLTNNILTNYFHTLEKEEFNLLFELNRFIKDYSYILNKKKTRPLKTIIKELKTLRIACLTLTFKEYYISIIDEIIYKSFEPILKQSKPKQGKQDSLNKEYAYEDVILPAKALRTLATLFHAIELVDLKVHLKESYLYTKYNIKAFSKTTYMADEKTLKLINDYIFKLTNVISAQEEEVKYLKTIKEIIKPDWRNPNFQLIKDIIYKKRHHEVDEQEFIEDLSNLSAFATLVIGEYLHVFGNITLNNVKVKTKDSKTINEHLFPYDMQQLFESIVFTHKKLQDTISKNLNQTPTFNDFNLYLERQNKEQNKEQKYKNDKTNKLFLLIIKTSKTFYEIAKRLFKNYLQEQEFKNMSRNERIKLVAQGNIYDRTIPYPDATVSLNYYLNNKTIKDTYLLLIQFAIEFMLLFRHKDILEKLDKIDTTAQEVASLQRIYNRMA